MREDGPDTLAEIVESWEAYGLRCCITFGLISFNGYVRIPDELFTPGAAERVLRASGGITWGPDDSGWVGFDTAHFSDYWTPDDLAPFLDPSAMRFANTMREMAERSPRSKRWTLQRLRDATEELAQQVAVALDLKDVPQADSPEVLSVSLRKEPPSE